MTTKIQRMYTPRKLSEMLGKDYASLRKSLNRLGYSYAHDQVISDGDLVTILEAESQLHPKRPVAVIEAAAQLLESVTNRPALTPYAIPRKSKSTAEEPDHVSDYLLEDKADKTETDKPETDKPEINKPETDKPETNKPETNKPETDKPNKLVLIMQGAFVAGLIGVQAWVYASLASSALAGGEHTLPHVVYFLAGVLVESAGVLIAAGMKLGKEKTEYQGGKRVTVRAGQGLRSAWLVAFFLFQFGIVSSHIGIWGVEPSAFLAKLLVALSIPGGILAYSHLYISNR